MVLAGTNSIFRVTAPGDTELNVTSANLIEFNTGAVVPDATGRMQETRVHDIEDISFQPNPNRHLDQLQDGKLGTREYILTGYIKKTGTSNIVVNLSNWMAQDKTNSDFKFGRFGVRLDDMSDDNLSPSGTIGLLLYDVERYRPENEPEIIGFILKLYRNGSI